MSKVTPIFIFSLPRSGSTILQKKIASHPQISTTGEPWLMLPLVFALRKNGLLSEYSHLIGHKGLMDVMDNLPNGEKDYYDALNLFANSIYSKLSASESTFFLDKTPRYYYIIKELNQIFPSAKFIFLVRNPISIYSSILYFGRNNRFSTLYNMIQDLYAGPALLAKGYDLVKDKSVLITYDELINNSEEITDIIYSYLGLEDIESNDTKNVSIKGSLGDRGALNSKGVNINNNSKDKWKMVFNTPLRKRIIKKYLSDIDNDYLKLAKLTKDDLFQEINQIKIEYKWLFRDLLDWIKLKLTIKFKLHLLIAKSMKYFRKNYFE